MAQYVTTAEVKTYLSITSTGDDALISTLIDAAQKWIETRTERKFSSTADTTRYLDTRTDAEGRLLYFDEDLVSITSVTAKADSTADQYTVSTGDYLTLPRYDPPYYGLRLLQSSTAAWEYEDDPENGVKIVGRWAYSTTPPDDIKHACKRLAAYLYRQKDSQVFDVTAIPEAGVITIPQGFPPDVNRIVLSYKRR